MKEYQASFPKIGYIITVDRDHVVISDSIIFDRSKSITIPISKVKNHTGSELRVGDKILYMLAEGAFIAQKTVTLKKIIARDLPVAMSLRKLLAKFKIAVTLEKNIVVKIKELQNLLKELLGVELSFTTSNEANLIIHISKDEGATLCPYQFSGMFRKKDALPFKLDVPYVSDRTLVFLHRISEPLLEKSQLRQTVLSFRILHALLHEIGYNEHSNLSSLVTEYEARIRGDPSLIREISEPECIMSWQNAHLFAAEHDPSEGPFMIDANICESCRANLGSLRWNDIEVIAGTIRENRFRLPSKTESDFPDYSRFGILYVLEKQPAKDSGFLLATAPIKSHQVITASQKTRLSELENSLLKGLSLFVPADLISEELVDARVIEKGSKLLVDFRYNSNESSEEFMLSSIKIAAKLSENHKIYDTSSLLHKLGIGGIHLTIRICWSSRVNKALLFEAAGQLGRLTGWKVCVDEKSTAELDSVSSRMSAILKNLERAKEPEEFKQAIRQLQDLFDTIQPRIFDVIDKPVVMVFVLPQHYHIPISTVGDVAAGETKSRLFSILPMPLKSDPVRLTSVTCKTCLKNYVEGRDYNYSNHLCVLLIHELLHITADLKDHRGECCLCYFNRPEMLPLRFSICEKCIQNDGQHVHKNCLMSYACQFCIASRLGKIKDLKDILCDACISKIRTETEYIHSYFVRINNTIYRELMAETGKKRLEERR